MIRRWLILSLCLSLLFGTALPVRAQPSVTAPPTLSAQAAALMDADSGRLLWGKEASTRLPMASTTKLMTALVVAESLSPGQMLTIPPQAVGIEGSSIYLYEGEALTVEDLLYALLLSSANDAATALAIAVAGDEAHFVSLMNDRAAQMGLRDTHFANPHGLPHPEHYTTAEELGLLCAHALANETVRTVMATVKRTIPLQNGAGARVLRNHNKLLQQYEGCIGGKTGFTRASGRCLVSAALRNGLTLIAVTLNAPNDWQDHKHLLDYGYSAYERVTVADVGSFHYEQPLTGGVRESVTLTNTQPLILTCPKTDHRYACTVETFSRFAFAPTQAGTPAGRVCVVSADGITVSAPLVCAVSVAARKPPKGFWARLLS